MKKKFEYIIIAYLLALLLISCSPSKDMIATYIYGTQTDWTIQPTYTNYPTYTFQHTKVKEITRIIIMTETYTPTPKYSLTITPTTTLPIIITTGYGILQAIPNQDGIYMSYFDLDTGNNGDNKTSDIEFSVGCGSACFPFVEPINGAISFIFGRKEPSYEDCVENMVSESYQISDEYICIATNKKNISIIKIGFPIQRIKGAWELYFYYKTWKHFGD